MLSLPMPDIFLKGTSRSLQLYTACWTVVLYKQEEGVVAAADSDIKHGLKDWKIRIPISNVTHTLNPTLDTMASRAFQYHSVQAFQSYLFNGLFKRGSFAILGPFSLTARLTVGS